MPVDEWAFVRAPQSGFTVHACVLPTRGLSLSTWRYLQRLSRTAQAALREALLKTGRLFLLLGGQRALQCPGVPAERVSPVSGGEFQDAELCSFREGLNLVSLGLLTDAY